MPVGYIQFFLNINLMLKRYFRYFSSCNTVVEHETLTLLLIPKFCVILLSLFSYILSTIIVHHTYTHTHIYIYIYIYIYILVSTTVFFKKLLYHYIVEILYCSFNCTGKKNIIDHFTKYLSCIILKNHYPN